jgi:hypothetical protein
MTRSARSESGSVVKIRLAFLDAVWLFAPAPPVFLGEPRPATELLACSIAYHDPQDQVESRRLQDHRRFDPA